MAPTRQRAGPRPGRELAGGSCAGNRARVACLSFDEEQALTEIGRVDAHLIEDSVQFLRILAA